VNAQLVHFSGPQDARAVGIETVYQDLALAPDLDAAANVFLGRELVRPGLLGRLGVLDKSRMVRQTGEAMARLGVTIRPSAEVFTLSGGQQQSAAVARAAMWATSAIFMDEPTANLGVVQTKGVLDLIRGCEMPAQQWSLSATTCLRSWRLRTELSFCAWAGRSDRSQPRQPLSTISSER